METKEHKCKVCGQKFVEMNVTADEFLHFNGTLYECKSCGLVVFPKETLYFSHDRSLTSEPPFAALLEGGLTGAKLNVDEADWVVVFPVVTSAEKVDGIELHVGRNRLNEDTALFALDAINLSFSSMLTNGRFVVGIKFLGFKADSREVYDIDEIRSWLAYVFQLQPDFICHMTAESLQLSLFTLVRGLPKDYFPATVKVSEIQGSRGAADLPAVVFVAADALCVLKSRFSMLSQSQAIEQSKFAECRSDFVQRLGKVSNFDFDSIFKFL